MRAGVSVNLKPSENHSYWNKLNVVCWFTFDAFLRTCNRRPKSVGNIYSSVCWDVALLIIQGPPEETLTILQGNTDSLLPSAPPVCFLELLPIWVSWCHHFLGNCSNSSKVMLACSLRSCVSARHREVPNAFSSQETVPTSRSSQQSFSPHAPGDGVVQKFHPKILLPVADWPRPTSSTLSL